MSLKRNDSCVLKKSKFVRLLMMPGCPSPPTQMVLGPFVQCVKPLVSNLWVNVNCFLSFDVFERVIHAFITTRLNYGSILNYGVSQVSVSRLQFVQKDFLEAVNETISLQSWPLFTGLQFSTGLSFKYSHWFCIILHFWTFTAQCPSQSLRFPDQLVAPKA